MPAKSEKEILLLTSDRNFTALFEIIESVPSRKRSISIETEERDKNFRDVLMHRKPPFKQRIYLSSTS